MSKIIYGVVFSILLPVFLTSFIVSVSAYQNYKKVQSYISVEGDVEISHLKKDGSRSFYPFVSYFYEYNNQRYHSNTVNYYEVSFNHKDIGKQYLDTLTSNGKTTVFFDKNDPSQSVLDIKYDDVITMRLIVSIVFIIGSIHGLYRVFALNKSP